MFEFGILRELLDTNYERSSSNVFVVGRPNFPEPGVNAAYDFVPVGFALRAVRRDTPITASSWWCESSAAWILFLVEVFVAPRDHVRSPVPLTRPREAFTRYVFP